VKRTEQVNVRLSPADLQLLRQAAERQWPGLELTNSTLLLTLAKLKAAEIMGKKALALVPLQNVAEFVGCVSQGFVSDVRIAGRCFWPPPRVSQQFSDDVERFTF
jgi:uncharacterized protein (DUF1778 family)